jgi:Ala-tRNA(Pro) deacylase
MAIAISLEQYLNGQGIAHDELNHKPTNCAARSASVSHVSADSMAKGVVLSSKTGFFLAVVPASRQVSLGNVGRRLKQTVALATEPEIKSLFPDCELGAVPPIGAAYGLRMIVDDELETQADIYFEGGDHRTLVHVAGKDFVRLMHAAPHGWISAEDQDSGMEAGYFGA